MTQAEVSSESPSGSHGNETPAWRGLLASWMILTIVLQGVVWSTGVTEYDLEDAVEQGAARAEERLLGDESRDVIRKEVQLQRDTLRFWTVLTMIGDFVVGPLSLTLRVLLVAVTFSAVAALSGRRVRYPMMMADCVRWQGVWVLGLAVQVILMFALHQDHIDTSILLVLPAPSLSAIEWACLTQVDLFAVLGWSGMAWSGWRRGQANPAVALLVCLGLAAVELSIRASVVLLINLSMRLTVMPQ